MKRDGGIVDVSSEDESIEKEGKQRSNTRKFNSYDYDQYQLPEVEKVLSLVIKQIFQNKLYLPLSPLKQIGQSLLKYELFPEILYLEPINYINLPQRKMEIKIHIVQFGASDYFGSFHLVKFISAKSIQQFDYLHRSYQKMLKRKADHNNPLNNNPNEEKSEDPSKPKLDRKNYKTDKVSVNIVEVSLLTNLLHPNFSYPKSHSMALVIEIMIKSSSLDEALNIFIRKIFEDVQEMTAANNVLVSPYLVIINHFREKQFLALPNMSTASSSNHSASVSTIEASQQETERIKRQQILSILKSAVMNEYEIFLEAYVLMEERLLPSYTYRVNEPTVNTDKKQPPPSVLLPAYQKSVYNQTPRGTKAGRNQYYDYYHKYYHNNTQVYDRYREASTGFLTMSRKYKLTYIDDKQVIKSFSKYPIESIISGVFHSLDDAKLCVNMYLDHLKSMKRRFTKAEEKSAEEAERRRKAGKSTKVRPPAEGPGSTSATTEARSKKREDKETQMKASRLLREYLTYICYNIIAAYNATEYYLMNEQMILLQTILGSSGATPSNAPEVFAQTTPLLEHLACIPTHLPRCFHPLREAIESFMKVIQLCISKLSQLEERHEQAQPILPAEEAIITAEKQKLLFMTSNFVNVISELKQLIAELIITNQQYSIMVALQPLFQKYFLRLFHRFVKVPAFHPQVPPGMQGSIAIGLGRGRGGLGQQRGGGGRVMIRLPTIDDLQRLLAALAHMDLILKHLETHASVEILNLLFQENFQSYQISMEQSALYGTGNTAAGLTSKHPSNQKDELDLLDDDEARVEELLFTNPYDNYHRYRSIFTDVPRCLLDLFGFALSRCRQYEQSSLQQATRAMKLPPLFATPAAVEQYYSSTKQTLEEGNNPLSGFFSLFREENDRRRALSEGNELEYYWKPYQLMNYYQYTSPTFTATEERLYPPSLLKELHYHRHQSLILNENYLSSVIHPNLFDYYFFCGQSSLARVTSHMNDHQGGILDHQQWLLQELDRAQDFPASNNVVVEKSRLRYLYHTEVLPIVYSLCSDLLSTAKRYPRFLLTNLLLASKIMKLSFRHRPVDRLLSTTATNLGEDKEEEEAEKDGVENEKKPKAEETFSDLLSQGSRSRNQYLFAILRKDHLRPLDHPIDLDHNPLLHHKRNLPKRKKQQRIHRPIYFDRPYRVSFPRRHDAYNRLFSAGIIGNDRLLACLGPYAYETIFTAIWNLPPLLPSPPSSTIGFTVKYLLGMTAISGLKLAYKFSPEVYYEEEQEQQRRREARRVQRAKRLQLSHLNPNEKNKRSLEETAMSEVKRYLKRQEEEKVAEEKRKKEASSGRWTSFSSKKKKDNKETTTIDIKKESDHEGSEEEDEDDTDEEEAETGLSIEEKSLTFINVDDGNLHLPQPYHLELVFFAEAAHTSYREKIRKAYSSQIMALVQFMIGSPLLLFSKISFPPLSSNNTTTNPFELEEEESLTTFTLADFLAEMSSSNDTTDATSHNTNMNGGSSLQVTIEQYGMTHGRCTISGGMLQLPTYHPQRMTLERLLALFQDSLERKIPTGEWNEDDFDEVFEFNTSNQATEKEEEEKQSKPKKKTWISKEKEAETQLPQVSKQTLKDMKAREKKRQQEQEAEEKDKKKSSDSKATGKPSSSSPRNKSERKRSSITTRPEKDNNQESVSNPLQASPNKSEPVSVTDRRRSSVAPQKKRKGKSRIGFEKPSSLASMLERVQEEGSYDQADDEEDDSDNDLDPYTKREAEDLDHDSSSHRYDPTYSDANRIYQNSHYQSYLSEYYSGIPAEDFVYVPFRIQFNLVVVKAGHNNQTTFPSTTGQPPPAASGLSQSKSDTSIHSATDRLKSSGSGGGLSRENSKEEFLNPSTIFVGRQEDLARYLCSTLWFSKETADTLWNVLLSPTASVTSTSSTTATEVSLMLKYLSTEVIRLQQGLQYYYHTSRTPHRFLECGIVQSLLLQYYQGIPPKKLLSDPIKRLVASNNPEEEQEEGLEDILFSLFHHISYKFVTIGDFLEMVRCQYVDHCSDLQSLSLIALERTIAQYVDLAWRYLITSPNCFYWQGLLANSLVLFDHFNYNNRLVSIPVSYARHIQDYSLRQSFQQAMPLVLSTNTNSKSSKRRVKLPFFAPNAAPPPEDEALAVNDKNLDKTLPEQQHRTDPMQSQRQKVLTTYWEEKKKQVYHSQLIQLTPYLLPAQIIAYSFAEAFPLLENIQLSSRILMELAMVVEMVIGLFAKDLLQYYHQYSDYLLSMTKRYYSLEENLEVMFGSVLDRLVSVKQPNQNANGESEDSSNSSEDEEEEDKKYRISKRETTLEQGIRHTCQRFLQAMSHQDSKHTPYFHFETIFSATANTSAGPTTAEEVMNIFYEFEEERLRQYQHQKQQELTLNNTFQIMTPSGLKPKRWRTPLDLLAEEKQKWSRYQTKLQQHQQQSKQLVLLSNITKITKLKQIVHRLKNPFSKKGTASEPGKRVAFLEKDKDEEKDQSPRSGVSDDRKLDLEIQKVFQEQWQQEQEKDLFLQNSLYQKVLIHEEKLDFLSNFHDESEPSLQQLQTELSRHDPISQYSFSTTGFRLVGETVQSSIQTHPTSMLTLLRAYGNVYQSQSTASGSIFELNSPGGNKPKG